MAKAKRSPSRGRSRGSVRRGPRRGGGGRPWLRRFALGVTVATFAAGFATASYLAHLDRIVRARFDGLTFGVPSRVYAAPAILYPGLDWKLFGLRGTLVRLGYREANATRDLPPGQFSWGRSRVRVHLRAFQHPSRPEPSRDVVLRLDGSQIEEIRALPSGREVGAVMLEPEQIGAYYGSDREQRELVDIGELPSHLVDAVVAVEDQRFESHPGIDIKRIVGAFVANIRAGAIRQGGSTLTQQLVKNFFLTPERTLTRKIQEALMALMVEARYDKRSILQAYLNEIYLGQRGATAIHGMGEAARLYFGKSARELTVAESALLAAIIQSPNGISPYRDPERATRRRNLVIELMHGQGRISDAQLEQAVAEPLRLAAVTPDPGDARYFLDLLRRQLSISYDEQALSTEGVKIYSTLDRRMQSLGAAALREGLEGLEQRFPGLARANPSSSLQGCLVAMRPQTGEILALVGGRDYRRSQFDRCTQAQRPAGSAFKPFVYAAAFESSGEPPFLTLASVLDDTPLEIETRHGPWNPQNYDLEFHGQVPVREAVERSFNVATARAANELGIDRVASMARRLGIDSRLPVVPSLALGTADVTPLEMARAYGTLASGGIRPEVQSVEDVVNPGGETLERRRIGFERVLDRGTAYLVTSLLEGVALRGTAAAVHRDGLRGPIAAKTGTSDQEHDLWLAGFTPELVVVVWIGFDQPQSLGIPASVGALPIWRRFVHELSGGRVRGRFVKPPTVIEAEVEIATGALALAGCRDTRTEYFLEGTLPEEVCPTGHFADGDDGRPGGAERVRRGFFQWLRKRMGPDR